MYIEFSGKKVLIIGGGYVGTRRALKFSDAGAYVVVIALKPSQEIIKASKSPNIDLIVMDASMFDLSRLHKVNLIVYTVPGNDALRGKILDYARNRGILVNDATNAKETEVVVPFEGEVYGIRFAVTSEGKSGVAASYFRDLIVEVLSDERYMNFAETWFKVKEYIKSSVAEYGLRMRIYERLKFDERFRELAFKGDVEGALKYVKEVIDSYAH